MDSINFLFWGMFYGFFIVVERVGFDKILQKSKIFSALSYIKRMIMPWRYTVSTKSIQELVDIHTFVVLLLAILGMGMFQRGLANSRVAAKWKNSIWKIIFCSVIMILSMISLASNTYNPFIYFRF